jgi:hypothetical protein
MRGSAIKHQQVGDRSIDTPNFNKMVDVANASMNIYFDPSHFIVHYDGGGMQVTLNRVDEEQNAQIVQTSPTAIRVNGSQCITYAHGTRYEVSQTTDGGTAPDISDATTISGITTTVYVYQIIDNLVSASTTTEDSLAPDQLRVLTNAAWPSETNYTVRVLGKVTCVNSKISKIEQYKIGDWYRYFQIIDGVSLQYVPDNDDGNQYKTQIYNWEKATTGMWDQTDIDTTADPFIVHDATDKSLHYIVADEFVQAVVTAGNVNWDAIGAGLDLSGNTSYLHENLDPTNNTDVRAAFQDNWDHDGHHWVKGHGVTGTRATSNYGIAIGLDKDTIVIDLANKELTVGTDTCLTWDATSVDIGDAAVKPLFNVLNATDAADAATAGATFAGGIAVAADSWVGGTMHTDTGLVLETAAISNTWTNSVAAIQPAGDVTITSNGAAYDILIQSGRVLALTSVTTLDLTVGTNLTIDSNTGLSTYGHTKGIFTDEAGLNDEIVHLIWMYGRP